MQRILVIGCCGAGKSHFSSRLQAKTQLELIRLDYHYWKPNWEPTARPEWIATIRDLINRPAWIMDGNYAGTLEIRLARADTVILLDYSTATCLWRITKRIVRHHGRVRPGMPAGCRERFDAKFYHYVATFNATQRSSLLKRLSQLTENQQLLVFRNDAEADRFLRAL